MNKHARRTSTGRMLSMLLVGLMVAAYCLAQRPGRTPPASAKPEPVFTPAHPSVLDAIKDFFNWRPTPVQPVAFSHKLHLAKGMRCTDCHVGVEQGPVAGIPSGKLCMTCHQVIAADRSEVQRVAAYLQRGQEIPWQRVYAYSPSAHVKFNHAPHVRAEVNCSECHGEVTQQTVAARAVDLTMGYCLNCHRQKKASTECTACHY